MDHVRLLAKVTAGATYSTPLQVRAGGKGTRSKPHMAPGAPGSLTQSVQAGARVAEVTNPDTRAKKMLSAGGLLCGGEILFVLIRKDRMSPLQSSRLKSAGLSILPTGKALDLKCIFH